MCGRLAMPEDELVLCNQHKRKPIQQASSLQLSVSGLPTPLVTANEPSDVSVDLTGNTLTFITSYVVHFTDFHV